MPFHTPFPLISYCILTGIPGAIQPDSDIQSSRISSTFPLITRFSWSTSYVNLGAVRSRNTAAVCFVSPPELEATASI